MSIDQAIRVRLINRRVALGLTQRQLADRMGVVQSRISHLEMGLNEPGVTTLGRWAEALGMRARTVLDESFGEEIAALARAVEERHRAAATEPGGPW